MKPPTGAPLELAPPLAADGGESEVEAPHWRRVVAQRKVELEFRHWRQDVCLPEFRDRASDVLKRLEQLPRDPPPDLDISTEGCRTISVQESVELGIQRSIAKASVEPEAEPPATKRPRVTEAPAASGSVADSKPCDELGIRAQRRQLAIKTASGRLLVDEEKKSVQLRKAWLTANQNVQTYFRYMNALGGDAPSAHRRLTRRIEGAASAGGGASPKRASVDDLVVTVHACTSQGFKEQEFDILASQPLSALRDAFYFVSDYMFDGPRRLSSACFFIDGIFYVDRRDELALDYAEGLIPWIQSTRPTLLRASEPMSMETRLCDLERIPFGERCIYIHQGDIEHSVIFTSARLLHPEHDCPYVEAFPVLTFMRRFTKRKCNACTARIAIWLILDATRCPHNPCFMCGQCFKHFFQDAAGEFLPPVDYKIFPYLHDE